MFTGLVECLAEVAEIIDEPPGKRLVIRAPQIAAEATLGESIAVNGCCLTVVAINQATFAFEAGPETLSRTNLGQLQAGSRVNLERSLQVGDRLGGHFVSGHIDAVGRLDQRDEDGEWATFWFRVPPELTRQMVSKGSIAVDGVSLTLVDVEPDRFSVQLIPHTLSVTTLGALKPGDPINLETDLLAKYAQKAVAPE
ncbi:MAG: riboflavin synthase [Planctomycetales bacterium]|nr:riboflavin synthase [Planctomycetales bacterium]